MPGRRALARRAIAAGGDDAMALVAAGFVLVMVGRDYDAGLDAVRRALELNPGSGFVVMLSSAALVFGGSPEDALVHAVRAMALSPLDPGFFMFLSIAGFAHLLSGRPEKALELAKRSAALYPLQSFGQASLNVRYGSDAVVHHIHADRSLWEFDQTSRVATPFVTPRPNENPAMDRWCFALNARARRSRGCAHPGRVS